MSDPDSKRPSDIMKGGREPAGENSDEMSPGAEHEQGGDVLEGGREPYEEDPDVMDEGRSRPQ